MKRELKENLVRIQEVVTVKMSKCMGLMPI